MSVTYLEALAVKFPKVNCYSQDGGSEYELLSWQGGDPLPSKEVLEIAKLEVFRDIVWREIQAIRDFRKANGVKIGAHWFHSDDTSRIQQLGLVMMGANLPANLSWKTLGNEHVIMTPQLAQQIFIGVATADQVIFGVAEYHKKEMLKLENPGLYNYRTAWPLTFGE